MKSLISLGTGLLVLGMGVGCGSDGSSSGEGTGGGGGATSGSGGAVGATGGSGGVGGFVSTGGATSGSGGTESGAGGVGLGSGGATGATGGAGGSTSVVQDKCVEALVPETACKVCENDATCAAPTLTDNGDGTIGSSCCGLTWQQGEADDVYMWPGAEAYCASLSLDGGGWRLPTKPELLTLVVKTTDGPMIDTTKFPDAEGSLYWTSQPDPKVNADSHWFVDFQPKVGGYTNHSVGTPNAHVRCVR